ncbi:nucleoid-associated protein [Marinobacterium sediminicola]|uniref:Nucleoid-associated protein n=1 Tax=Marinobacterium sediminicola TaxID=518898 RepID=A0ABY1S072_9GAMM|nr:nucleoid-associated protein [Marinobacterium sediminicola]ULG70065.1 nucleoid-associated protein [Marinobacterium sediminicola]SMR74521.1 nucleoid-associated protein [Marinobacterium sediminicola]
MPATAAIAHRLTRRTGDQSYSLREAPFDREGLNNRLLAELKPLFTRRASKRYGCFADEATVFKGLLVNWRDQNLGFTQFTAKVIEHLAMLMEQEDLETDGHWLFVEEELEAAHRLWIAQLKQKDGLLLNNDNDLQETGYIDFAKTGLCACIDLHELSNPDGKRYLTLSFGFGDRPLQQPLMVFFGFTDTVDTQADTERFMEVVSDYAESMPEENAKRYQKEVAEFCMEQSKEGAAVNYRELAGSVDSVAEVSLDEFIAERAPEMKEEFIPDRSSLKKYIRYTGRTKEVSISFSNESLGRSITFDPSTETLTLKDLPSALVKQLKGE